MTDPDDLPRICLTCLDYRGDVMRATKGAPKEPVGYCKSGGPEPGLGSTDVRWNDTCPRWREFTLAPGPRSM